MKIILFFLSVLLLTGCKTVKEIPYLQNSADFHYDESIKPYDMTIRPKDRLLITVHSSNRESVLPFNLVEPVNVDANKNRPYSYTSDLKKYLVDNNGDIDYPLVGHINLKGQTLEQAQSTIKQSISKYFSANADYSVVVKIINYDISVLGEVNRPNTFTISANKVNVMEALAMAGDMTIYGIRTNVKLLREQSNGEYEIHQLDLTDANLFNSPYYYMEQRDILYVEPNSVMAQNAKVAQTTRLWVRGAAITVSLGSLLYMVLN